MRALVTGATGFVGRALLARLDGRPVVLTRDPARARAVLGEGPELHAWDGAAPPPADAFRDVDVVFHLAGEGVASGRWTEERKALIRDSRVSGTRRLVQAMAELAPSTSRPKVLVSASAVGVYGDRGEEVLTESSSIGTDFLAGVCRAWEAEAMKAHPFGIRVILARLGVVLGSGGGALSRMLPPFRMGLGGRLGSGTQWMSWIHRDDLVGLLLHAAASGSPSGPMNAVSPEPVRNTDFTKALGRALGRPAMLPVPAFALRMALGEMAGFLLASQRVVPKAAEAASFPFRFPALDGALKEVLAAS